MNATRYLIFLVGLLGIGACSPPSQTVLDQCRASATAKAAGHDVVPSELEELVEECMLLRGYQLNETGSACADDLKSALNRRCYYPDTIPGHFRNYLVHVLH